MTTDDQSSNLASDPRRRLIELLMRGRGLSAARIDRIPRSAKKRSSVPLSFNQEGLWFLNQLCPERPYGVTGCLKLEGKLNPAILRQSLEVILGRHEILRTNFVSAGGEATQLVSESTDFPLDVIDLELLPAELRIKKVVELATLDAATPFDLGKDLLIRGKLVRLTPDSNVLLINLHHIIADGWSMGLLMHELGHAYSNLLKNEPIELKELAIQYSDYSVWQRDRLKGSFLNGELKFWEEYLEEIREIDALTPEQIEDGQQGVAAGHSPITISSEISCTARELACRSNVTFFVVLCSAFQCFVNYHAKQSEVVIGSSFANRQQPELEEMIGHFVNTLPLRISFSGNPTMRELLQRTQKSVLQVHEHQELPFVKIVQHLRPTRSTTRNPIFQVVFDLLTPDRNPAVFGYGLGMSADEQHQIGDLTATPIPVDGSDARFDLAVFLWDSPAAIQGVFEYDASRFSSSSVSRWIWQFQTLLEMLVRFPDMKLTDVYQKLDAEERMRAHQRRKAYTKQTRKKLGLTKRKAVPMPPASDDQHAHKNSLERGERPTSVPSESRH